MLEILIHVSHEETKVALIEDKQLAEFFFERKREAGVVGNIYKGRVNKVLPGMQAAFVDVGLEKAAFLYVDDIYVEGSEILPGELADEQPSPVDVTESVAPPPLGEEATPRAETPKRPARRPIEEIISEGQEILLQMTKEPISTKGPRATTYISLPGRYLVYMPQVNHIGVSRRITNEEERQRLKEMVGTLKSGKGGYIIRTVAEGMSEAEARSDIIFLELLWQDIRSRSESIKAPALVREDLDVVFRTIRDYLTTDVETLYIDDRKEYQRIMDFITTYMPDYASRVRLWDGNASLFATYDVERQLSKALEKKVWLKSGGYLVIDRAEALTVVDVNTGRFVGENDPEATILQTNLEAVTEIARQLRLRNIGGIIIIDFIDMEKEKNRERVFQGLQESLAHDKARTNALKISDLGLVEMSRKRVREDLVHLLGETCAYCDGKGYTKSLRTIAYEILEELRSVPSGGQNPKDRRVILFVHPEIQTILQEDERDFLESVERKIRRQVIIKSDPLSHIEEFSIVAP
ncbi:MAG: Rne/Rng family ribonuclease [Leptospirales bacterium]